VLHDFLSAVSRPESQKTPRSPPVDETSHCQRAGVDVMQAMTIEPEWNLQQRVRAVASGRISKPGRQDRSPTLRSTAWCHTLLTCHPPLTLSPPLAGQTPPRGVGCFHLPASLSPHLDLDSSNELATRPILLQGALYAFAHGSDAPLGAFL
jgi:hypothetical protein